MTQLKSIHFRGELIDRLDVEVRAAGFSALKALSPKAKSEVAVDEGAEVV